MSGDQAQQPPLEGCEDGLTALLVNDRYSDILAMVLHQLPDRRVPAAWHTVSVD
jgi:hypothetical protein